MHAGVDHRLLECDVSSVNQVLRHWMAYLQGIDDDHPGEDQAWFVKENARGPLWTHRFGVAQADSVTPGEVATVIDLLSRFGADRVVFGHIPTARIDFMVGYPQPAYGELVAAIDTGISCAFGGRLSAVDLSDGAVRPCYFERGTEETETTRRIRASFQERLRKWA